MAPSRALRPHPVSSPTLPPLPLPRPPPPSQFARPEPPPTRPAAARRLREWAPGVPSPPLDHTHADTQSAPSPGMCAGGCCRAPSSLPGPLLSGGRELPATAGQAPPIAAPACRPGPLSGSAARDSPGVETRPVVLVHSFPTCPPHPCLSLAPSPAPLTLCTHRQPPTRRPRWRACRCGQVGGWGGKLPGCCMGQEGGAPLCPAAGSLHSLSSCPSPTTPPMHQDLGARGRQESVGGWVVSGRGWGGQRSKGARGGSCRGPGGQDKAGEGCGGCRGGVRGRGRRGQGCGGEAAGEVGGRQWQGLGEGAWVGRGNVGGGRV